MVSTSSANGQLTLTVYFSLDTNPDIAQVQVQNRVNLAATAADRGHAARRRSEKSSSIMMRSAFAKGDCHTPDYVANFANVYVLDARAGARRRPGAGDGRRGPGADLDEPDRMASLSITTTDIASAVQSRMHSSAPGQIGQQPTAGQSAHLPVVTQAPLSSRAVREHHPAREPGWQRLRVGDVARAEIGCGSTSSMRS